MYRIKWMVAHESLLYHHNHFSVSRQWTIAQTFQKIFLGSKVLFVSLPQFHGSLYYNSLNFQEISKKVSLTPEESSLHIYGFPRRFMPPPARFSKKSRRRRKVPGLLRGEPETIGLGYRGHRAETFALCAVKAAQEIS
ncbi:MAG: hypothetical protein HFG05_11100 [Oscillibacter sp.]|nr:hypothetical protein [Oscillibacter sp.]